MCQAEVEDAQATLAVEDQIRGFDVAVDDPLRVCVLEAVGDVGEGFCELLEVRRPVFLSGLAVLGRIMEKSGATGLKHVKASVKDGMAARLVKLLHVHKPDDLHSTLLLRQDSEPPQHFRPPS